MPTPINPTSEHERRRLERYKIAAQQDAAAKEKTRYQKLQQMGYARPTPAPAPIEGLKQPAATFRTPLWMKRTAIAQNQKNRRAAMAQNVTPGETTPHEKWRLSKYTNPVKRSPEAAAAGEIPAAGADTRPGMAMREPTYKPGGTGSRYLDMYYSATPEQRGQFTKNQNLIHMIRGTQQTWGNPAITGGNGVREFASPLEAAHGMRHEDAMARYGIEAPIQADLEKQRIAAKNRPVVVKAPESKLTRVVDEKGREMVYDSSLKRFMSPEDTGVGDDYQVAQSLASQLPNMDDAQIQEELRKMNTRQRQLLQQIVEQLGAGGR